MNCKCGVLIEDCAQCRVEQVASEQVATGSEISDAIHELGVIRERLQKAEEGASPAPWEYARLSLGGGLPKASVRVPWGLLMWWTPPGQPWHESECDTLLSFGSREYSYFYDEDGNPYENGEMRSWHAESPTALRQFANLRLIAESRNSAPRLLQIATELEAEVARLRTVAQENLSGNPPVPTHPLKD